MTNHIAIEFVLPQGQAPAFSGFTIMGHTAKVLQNVQVYYEIPANGVMSANQTTVSDEDGKWRVMVRGEFLEGTEIIVYARNGTAELARFTKTLE
ncbi:MAG: hypothetical protein JKY27_03035 [Magnetovibrio sp.]|nr:hypothetical protein [Magnetovibrio sp.]